MQLNFTKMHGLGNDFMVVDLVTQQFALRPEFIRQLANRNFGIGFDQLLIVETPSSPDVDFRYRIFNADGGEVEQCGNGARCFARFVYDHHLTGKRLIKVETASGVIELCITDDDQVTVDMGAPVLEPSDIPFATESQATTYTIEANGQSFEISAVSMGNPHCVVLVDDIDTADVDTLGPLLENHEQFPNRVNVGFMQIISRTEARLRVYERGAAETLACGTGACAAMVAGHLQGLFDDAVKIHLPGGTLDIQWNGKSSVMMTGPATSVFEGQIQV